MLYNSKVNYKEFANFYYNKELNVTCINNYYNQFNISENNLLKSPSHEWKKFVKERQKLEELESYDWLNSVGVGIVLGYKNLCSIDIDGCLEENFIKFLLIQLGIYENESMDWVFKSGSQCGFHILFYCPNLPLTETSSSNYLNSYSEPYYDEKFGLIDCNAYYPKDTYLDRGVGNYSVEEMIDFNKKYNDVLLKLKYLFKTIPIENNSNLLAVNEIFDNSGIILSDLFQKIEFRWKGHLVLPPSLHQSGSFYSYKNSGGPQSPIPTVSFNQIVKVKEMVCFLAAEASGGDTTRSKTPFPDSVKKVTESVPNTLVLSIQTEKLLINSSKKQESEIVTMAWVILDRNNHLLTRKSFVISNQESCDIPSLVINESIRSSIGVNILLVVEALIKDLQTISNIVFYDSRIILEILKETFVKLDFSLNVILKKKIISISEDLINEGASKNESILIEDLYESLFYKPLVKIKNSLFLTTVTALCFKKLLETERLKI